MRLITHQSLLKQDFEEQALIQYEKLTKLPKTYYWLNFDVLPIKLKTQEGASCKN